MGRSPVPRGYRGSSSTATTSSTDRQVTARAPIERPPCLTTARHPSPYRLIATDDPCKTLAQGEVRYFASMIDAANAFVKAAEPYKTVIYDDGCTARELNRDEQRLLENVCAKLGYDVEAVEA